MTFIDIDHAIKDGEIVSKEAKRLLELLPDTYTEKSVSGTGIHILLKGSLPPDAYRRNDRKGIEMYDSRRFICMTGDIMNRGREIKRTIQTRTTAAKSRTIPKISITVKNLTAIRINLTANEKSTTIRTL
jgi:primase-polymerase (primpol)-like protein